MRLRFLGGAGEVTGSCTLVEAGDARFLVDCGMFQGGHDAWEKNLAALDFDLRRLDFVLLTHAHIDHSGLLPRLVALGYKGPIHVTATTAELLEVMLLDSAHLQEKDAEWRSRHRDARRRHPMAPLYTVNEANACLEQLRGRIRRYGEKRTRLEQCRGAAARRRPHHRLTLRPGCAPSVSGRRHPWHRIGAPPPFRRGT